MSQSLVPGWYPDGTRLVIAGCGYVHQIWYSYNPIYNPIYNQL